MLGGGGAGVVWAGAVWGGVVAGRVGDGALGAVAGGDVAGGVDFVAGVLLPAAHPVAIRAAARLVSSVAAIVRFIRSPE